MKPIFNIPTALMSIRPNAQWVLRGDDYSGLEWLDTEQTKPTEDEISAEIERIRAEYELVKYQDQRRPEYPPLTDLADALYWQAQGDESKMTSYLAAVQAVKDKYPKAE